eukprot:5841211-Prymnesium_polylepis.1
MYSPVAAPHTSDLALSSFFLARDAETVCAHSQERRSNSMERRRRCSTFCSILRKPHDDPAFGSDGMRLRIATPPPSSFCPGE